MVQSLSSVLPQTVPLFASAFTFIGMTMTGVDLTATQVWLITLQYLNVLEPRYFLNGSRGLAVTVERELKWHTTMEHVLNSNYLILF